MIYILLIDCAENILKFCFIFKIILFQYHFSNASMNFFEKFHSWEPRAEFPYLGIIS